MTFENRNEKATRRNEMSTERVPAVQTTFAKLRDRFVDPEKEQLRAELARFREKCPHADTTLNGDGTMTCDLCGFTEPDPFHAGQPAKEES